MREKHARLLTHLRHAVRSISADAHIASGFALLRQRLGIEQISGFERAWAPVITNCYEGKGRFGYLDRFGSTTRASPRLDIDLDRRSSTSHDFGEHRYFIADEHGMEK